MSEVKKEKRMLYDLSGVDPRRRSDIARRIEAAERFDENPGRTTAENEAKGLGISTSAFYNLVAEWRRHRDPMKMPGARTRRRGHGIEQSAAQLIERIAGEHPESRIGDVIFRVKEYASIHGVGLPTDQTIGTHVRRLRERTAPDIPPVSHFLDRCLWDVPIAAGSNRICRPLLTMVIENSTLSPVGIHLGLDEADYQSAALAVREAVSRGSLSHRDTILMDREVGPGWIAVERALCGIEVVVEGFVEPTGTSHRDAGSFRRRGNGRLILTALGRSVAGFPIKILSPRTLSRPSLEANALNLDDARNLLIRRLLAPSSTTKRRSSAAISDRFEKSFVESISNGN